MIEAYIEAIVLFAMMLSLIIALYPVHVHQTRGSWLFLAIIALLTAGVVGRLDAQGLRPYSDFFFHGIGVLGSAVFMFIISYSANRRMRGILRERKERAMGKP